MKIKFYWRGNGENYSMYKKIKIKVDFIPRKNEIVIIDEDYYKVKEVAYEIKNNEIVEIGIYLIKDE